MGLQENSIQLCKLPAWHSKRRKELQKVIALIKVEGGWNSLKPVKNKNARSIITILLRIVIALNNFICRFLFTLLLVSLI